MAANKNLPMFLIAGGIGIVALLFGFSRKSSASSNTPKTNPDPINHPNAVLIGGLWRDNSYYYDPYSVSWKPLNSLPADLPGAVKSVFDRVFPQYSQRADSSINYNYLGIFVRVTSGYDAIEIGDQVKITHKDYNGRTATVNQKFKAADGNYFALSTPWNFFSTSIQELPIIKLKYNTSGGQLTKIS